MEWVRLGDIADINSGGTPRRSNLSYWKNGNIPWIKISDLKEKYVNKSEEFITDDGLNNSSAKMFVEGTILYTIFATIGEAAILKIPATTNQAIAGINITNDSYNVEYIYYYLLSIKEKIKKESRGVAQNNINLTILKNLKIPSIDKVKQNEVVNTLKLIEKLIEIRKEQIQACDDLIESLFFDMLQYELMSDKIEYSKLGDLTSHISSGFTPRGGSSIYKSEGIPLIRSQDVKMNNLDYSNVVYIDTETHDKMKRSKLKNRDVLLNITGASIGRTAVFYGEDDSANTNQHVAAIRLKDEKVSPEFLLFYFSTEYFQAIIKNISSGGTREALNYKQIREFDIPLISKIKQEKFIKNKEKIEEEKKKLNSSLVELETLFEALMQDAFSGNLFKD